MGSALDNLFAQFFESFAGVEIDILTCISFSILILVIHIGLKLIVRVFFTSVRSDFPSDDDESDDVSKHKDRGLL